MQKFLIITAVVGAFAGHARADRDFEFPKTDNFDGAAVSAIKIDMDYGEISLVKSSDTGIKIDYKNTVYARNESEAKDLDNDCKYSAEISGNRLIIKVEQSHHQHHGRSVISRIVSGDWNDDIHPMLRVTIPNDKSVQINSASADIEASEVNCDLKIQSASSDITLENTTGNIECNVSSGDMVVTGHRGSLKLDGNSSDLRLTDITGDIDTRSASGDANLDKVKGNVRVATSSGDCSINDINGDLNVSSSSGEIVADGVSGSVHAEAVSGDIRLSALSAAQGDFDVESVSGDVQMDIIRDFAGEIALRSVSGNVNSRISAKVTYENDSGSHSQIRGMVGEGKGRLNVASTSGDININSY